MAVSADWLCAMIPAPPPCLFDGWNLDFCLSDSSFLLFLLIIMDNCHCGFGVSLF